MSRRRFFAPPSAFHKQTVTLAAEEAKHLREVLRLKTGDEVFVFDGTGKEFRCQIATARRDETLLDQCEEVTPSRPESPLKLTLAIALLKGDKFDLAVQKTTELGVSEILPVITHNADIRLRDVSEAEKRVHRWRRIALEASKQCGRAKVPHIDLPIKVERLLRDVDHSVRFMFAERDGDGLTTVLFDSSRPASVIALIGSEGGWSADEIFTARDSGWLIVTLNGRIMRAETAAIAATVLLQHFWGDLR